VRAAKRRRRGAPPGNRNAVKSGHFTAAAKAGRRRVSTLLGEIAGALDGVKPFIRQGKMGGARGEGRGRVEKQIGGNSLSLKEREGKIKVDASVIYLILAGLGSDRPFAPSRGDRPMTRQITKDTAYNAVAPGDFAALIEPERYNTRSSSFDKIIAATHDHFWDPLDKRYIDFTEPFDLENVPLLPEYLIPALQTKLVDEKLKGKERTRFINQVVRWMLSAILHGEQGALSLSASLCNILYDPGAQEYAANQTREEARHVTAFSRYIQARWGKPLPIGPTLGNLLAEMVGAHEVYKKIVGMQMLVEGLAMGAFATFFNQSSDPLLRKLMQLVMTDEAFHHKFGKIWADRTIPKLSREEHDIVEDWAAQCFQTLLFNLVNPEQMKELYADFGLDWQEVMAAFLEVATDEERRKRMQESADIFRVLIKTLLNANIITDRTRVLYATYVDMDELKKEGTGMVGDAIAEEGIAFLKTINFKAKGAKLSAVAAE
jgi:hypothetical protein